MVALVCILHSLGQAILESGGVSQQRFRLCNGFRPQALRLHRTKLPQERRPFFGRDVATHVADHVPELVRGERTQLDFQFLRKRFQRKPGCILHIQQIGGKRSLCKITHKDFEPAVVESARFVVNPESRQRDDYSPRQIEAARRVLVDLGHPQRVGGHGRRIAPQSSRQQFRRCHCHRHSLGRDVVALPGDSGCRAGG